MTNRVGLLLVVLALAGCATPAQQACRQKYPEPDVASGAEYFGGIGALIKASAQSNDPAHVQWQKDYDACVAAKQTE
jgi:hypothetical protein